MSIQYVQKTEYYKYFTKNIAILSDNAQKISIYHNTIITNEIPEKICISVVNYFDSYVLDTYDSKGFTCIPSAINSLADFDLLVRLYRDDEFKSKPVHVTLKNPHDLNDDPILIPVDVVSKTLKTKLTFALSISISERNLEYFI